jgi:hypothetical protein
MSSDNRPRRLSNRSGLSSPARPRSISLEATPGALGACAAAISLAAALWLPPLAIVAMNRQGADVSPDWRVLALVTTLVAGAVVGSSLAPALRGTGSLTLRHYGSPDAKLRLRSGFLAVQVAASPRRS